MEEIEINVDIEASVTITANEDDVLDAIENYKGDLKEWAKDNWKDKTFMHCIDIEDVDCEFMNDTKAEEAIEKIWKESGRGKDGRPNEQECLKNWLDDSKANDWPPANDLEEITVTSKALKLAKYYCDFEPRNNKLAFLYVANDFVVATNAQKMIKISGAANSPTERTLVPKCFIDPVLDGGSIYKYGSDKTALYYNYTWYVVSHESIEYVDFDNVFTYCNPSQDRFDFDDFMQTARAITNDAVIILKHPEHPLPENAERDWGRNMSLVSVRRDWMEFVEKNIDGPKTVHVWKEILPVYITAQDIEIALMPLFEK